MKTQRLRYLVLGADLIWVVAAMDLGYLLRYGGLGLEQNSVLVSVPLLLLALFWWSVLSWRLRLDGFRGGWRVPAVLAQLLSAVLGLMAMLSAGGYLAGIYTSRLALGYFGILLFLGFVVIRFTFRWFLAFRYRLGAVRKVVVVGNGPLAREMAATIDRHPELLCQIVGFLWPAEDICDLARPQGDADKISLQTIGIVDLLQSRRVDEIILAVPEPGHAEVLDLAAMCRTAGLAVSVVPQPYELYLSKPELTDLDGLPLLQWDESAKADLHWKRFLDLALAVCLLPLAIAAMAPAALVLKGRKGKAFRSELRCGQGGKTFWMYRLNSERHGTELPAHESFMQRCSLTELPQLVNVLRGEMSLVGPRPEGPERTRHYSDWNQQRLGVKPGMTGLAQVHGLRDQNSSEEKTRYDLQYILHRSPFQDISLLLQTLWTITPRLFQRRQLQARCPKAAAETSLESLFQEPLTGAHRSQSSSD